MLQDQSLDFASFAKHYFNTLASSDAVTQNTPLSKMAVFQKRYSPKSCQSNSQAATKYIDQNKDIFKCYDTDGVENKEKYGDGSEGFVYLDYAGVGFSTAGRDYSTDGGFYLFLDAANLTKAGELLQSKISNGWVDPYTNYIGLITNLYQPNFELLLVFTTIYDYRYGYAILVDRDSNTVQYIHAIVGDQC